MRKEERRGVSGLHAPRPRATPWAALLIAVGLCVVFLLCLFLWRVATAVLV